MLEAVCVWDCSCPEMCDISQTEMKSMLDQLATTLPSLKVNYDNQKTGVDETFSKVRAISSQPQDCYVSCTRSLVRQTEFTL